MEALTWLICGIVSYLLGAVPTAYLVGRVNGIDIRKVGSGNVGATNVFRVLGKWWGIFTFLADAAKGFVPAFVLPTIATRMFGYAGNQSHLGLLCAAAAVAGHNWPVYLGFKGGKGVATSAGALLGLAPIAGAIGFGVWIVVFLAGRYVSLASIAAAAAIGASAWFVCRGDAVMPAVLTVLGAVLILRHRSNIVRLLNGTENRFEFRKNAVQEKMKPQTDADGHR